MGLGVSLRLFLLGLDLAGPFSLIHQAALGRSAPPSPARHFLVCLRDGLPQTGQDDRGKYSLPACWDGNPVIFHPPLAAPLALTSAERGEETR